MDKRTKAQRAAAELKRRVERAQRFDPSRALFQKQLAFVSDPSPIVLASCSRRAGKSTGAAWRLISSARKFPGAIIPYIVMAREQARDIIWPPLRQFDREYELGLRFKENSGDIVFPNGSKVVLRGAGSKREIEKLRGIKFPEAVVDEAQTFGSILRYLLEDVIEPAMMDYGHDSRLSLIGPPNPACAGPFYDMICAKNGNGEPKFPHHMWTVLDNPHIPFAEEFLERKRAQFGGEVPTFLREYRGIWVKDIDALVFRLNEQLNVVDRFPREDANDWVFTLGIDLGFNDPTAFVVLAYSELLEKIYVVESFEESGLTQSRVAAYVTRLEEKYGFAKIVADSQGYGKAIVEGLKQEFFIPAEAAKKREKPAHIELLNGDLRTGTLLIVGHANESLIEQMRVLQWDADKLEDNKFAFHDSKFPDHLADALVYGYRDARPHTEQWDEEPPRLGSREWETAREKAIESQFEARYLAPQTDQNWFDD